MSNAWANYLSLPIGDFDDHRSRPRSDLSQDPWAPAPWRGEQVGDRRRGMCGSLDVRGRRQDQSWHSPDVADTLGAGTDLRPSLPHTAGGIQPGVLQHRHPTWSRRISNSACVSAGVSPTTPPSSSPMSAWAGDSRGPSASPREASPEPSRKNEDDDLANTRNQVAEFSLR